MEARNSPLDEARRLLVAKTFIGSLPAAAVDTLMAAGHLRRWSKGKPLFERGDAGDSLFVVLSGSLKIANVTADGREVVLNFLGEGDINGEIAALDGGARTATATAMVETEVFQIYRRDLLPILSRHPDALLEIVVLLCEKLRATSEIVEDNLRDMRGRFAAGLLRLSRQLGRRTARGIEIDLGASQRDLGNYLGLSRENTSRQVSALAGEGVLVMEGGVLVIFDEAVLSELSDGEGV
jgi:CRP-like cAMP-binding protein